MIKNSKTISREHQFTSQNRLGKYLIIIIVILFSNYDLDNDFAVSSDSYTTTPIISSSVYTLADMTVSSSRTDGSPPSNSNTVTTTEVVLFVLIIVILAVITIIITVLVIYKKWRSKLGFLDCYMQAARTLKKISNYGGQEIDDNLDNKCTTLFKSTTANQSTTVTIYEDIDNLDDKSVTWSSKTINQTTAIKRCEDTSDDKSATLAKGTTANRSTEWTTYEDMDVVKTKNLTSATKHVSEYEDIEELRSKNPRSVDSGSTKISTGYEGNDNIATNDESQIYNKLDHKTGLEQNIKQLVNVSENTYSTLETNASNLNNPTNNRKGRSVCISEMYDTVNKPSPRPVCCDTQSKVGDDGKDVPNVLEKREIESSFSMYTDILSPKPMCHNTKSRQFDSNEASPPPEIPEKSHDLVIYLEAKYAMGSSRKVTENADNSTMLCSGTNDITPDSSDAVTSSSSRDKLLHEHTDDLTE